jgi:hypothetical protein
VNAEQASKCLMRCRPAKITGKAAVVAGPGFFAEKARGTSDTSATNRRGSGDGTLAQEINANTGSPHGAGV